MTWLKTLKICLFIKLVFFRMLPGFIGKYLEKKWCEDSITKEVINTIKDISFDDSKIKDVLDFSEKSLNEVKHLTEYEDDKANRILTAVAFLSAMSGLIYVNFNPKFEFSLTNKFSLTYHVLFLAYAAITILGALLIILAVRPYFNIPVQWKSEKSKPNSYLFFEKIIEVTPENWINAFSSSDIKQRYAKNYILETYLVAEKIRDKLAILQFGVWLIQFGTLILFVWVLFFSYVSVMDLNKSLDSNLHSSGNISSKSQLVAPENVLKQSYLPN